MKAVGGEVVSIGKIKDIFAGRGITKAYKANGIEDLFDTTLKAVKETPKMPFFSPTSSISMPTTAIAAIFRAMQARWSISTDVCRRWLNCWKMTIFSSLRPIMDVIRPGADQYRETLFLCRYRSDDCRPSRSSTSSGWKKFL